MVFIIKLKATVLARTKRSFFLPFHDTYPVAVVIKSDPWKYNKPSQLLSKNSVKVEWLRPKLEMYLRAVQKRKCTDYPTHSGKTFCRNGKNLRVAWRTFHPCILGTRKDLVAPSWTQNSGAPACTVEHIHPLDMPSKFLQRIEYCQYADFTPHWPCLWPLLYDQYSMTITMTHATSAPLFALVVFHMICYVKHAILFINT